MRQIEKSKVKFYASIVVALKQYNLYNKTQMEHKYFDFVHFNVVQFSSLPKFESQKLQTSQVVLQILLNPLKCIVTY